MIWFADVYSYAGVKAAYAFPTIRAVDDFVESRLDPVLKKGYYSTILNKNADSKKKKFIRDTFITFRTSSKPGAFEGIDVDYVSLDEYDRAARDAELSAIQSMNSSPFKYMRRWSTPTTPNMGIDKLFKESDQQVYMHKCDHCGHVQELDFEKNIECVDESGIDLLAKEIKDGTYRFVCSKCNRTLDRWYSGSWVARYPGRTLTRGYLITQLNAVFMTADKIKQAELDYDSKQVFYNYVLGKPYENTAMAVKPDDVLRNKQDDLPQPLQTRQGDRYRFISVGVDFGKTHWISVKGFRDEAKNGKHIDTIALHAVPEQQDFSDIREIIAIIRAYQPDIILADIGYNGNKVYELKEEFGYGKAYGVQVNSNPRSTGMTNPTWNDTTSDVKIDKLTENKKYISELKRDRIGFYQEEDRMLNLLILHLENVVIREERDDVKKETHEIITNKGDD